MGPKELVSEDGRQIQLAQNRIHKWAQMLSVMKFSLWYHRVSLWRRIHYYYYHHYHHRYYQFYEHKPSTCTLIHFQAPVCLLASDRYSFLLQALVIRSGLRSRGHETQGIAWGLWSSGNLEGVEDSASRQQVVNAPVKFLLHVTRATPVLRVDFETNVSTLQDQ